MQEFLNMGGYAAYVWSAYGIALVALVLTVWLPLRRHKQQLKSLARRVKHMRS